MKRADVHWQVRHRAYGYDGQGNLTRRREGETEQYDADNRLVATRGSTRMTKPGCTTTCSAITTRR
ncbi:hypothetical protein PJ912_12175 [Pectobacterium colocasium]|uniref:hypothetical protein n=1 Tax=Pectobacterium TaxID=122277 RepID=UPI0027A094A4|nr:hypothetical protein KXZ65_11460 [Pectobacterium sp. PL152]WED70033.1 hypothetical protein PJ912_12175 [Pectobacterium colocasium]